MSANTVPAELEHVRRHAHCLASAAEIGLAMDRIAARISDDLQDSNPLLLGVMTGGVVPLSMLIQRLEFPLQVDYVHLTRYGAQTDGGELSWIKRPPAAVRDRTVLLVDDILDHGITLAALAAECIQLGAARVLTAVLVTKEIGVRSGLAAADYSALTLPDAYLFGYGMDYKTYLRNAPGVFAVDTP